MWTFPRTEYEINSDDDSNEDNVVVNEEAAGEDEFYENEGDPIEEVIVERLARVMVDAIDEDAEDMEVTSPLLSKAKLETLTNEVLCELLAERGLAKQGRKSQLVERLLNPQPYDFEVEQGIEKWQNSVASDSDVAELNEESIFEEVDEDECLEKEELAGDLDRVMVHDIDEDAEDMEVILPLPSKAELETLTNEVLHQLLAERGLVKQGRKAELVKRLLKPQPSDYRVKQRVKKWQSSVAFDSELREKLSVEEADEDACDENEGGPSEEEIAENSGGVMVDDIDEDAEDMEVISPLPSKAKLETLTNEVLYELLAKRGLVKRGRKAELVERLLNPQPSDYKVKQRVEKWRNSKAKATLMRLFEDGSSSFLDLTPGEAWESSDLFKQYKKANFIANYNSLKESVRKRMEIVNHDNITIAAELAVLREINQTQRSYPKWDIHPARALLESDLKEGTNHGMQPADFQETRPEYLEFPLTIFRRHIYQEERKQREMPMKVAKRNKIAENKYRKEAQREADRWHEFDVDNESD